MLRPFFMLVALLVLTAACAAHRVPSSPADRTFLVVVAHPDDESMVSPLLSRYAREGAIIHLVIATDGAKGVREHAGIPAGDALAAERAEEARCASRALGIEPPILLGLPDGELSDWQHLAALERELREVLRRTRPDVILTWGPDGGTGHPDHRMVSSVVTALVQEGVFEGFEELYYPVAVAPRKSATNDVPPAGLRLYTGDERFFPVRVQHTDGDRQRAVEALACHASQFTAEERAGIAHLWSGVTYLRKWNGGSRRAL